MTDWAAWGTSVGTLPLAGAMFAAVRSSNRTARIAERTPQVGLRPVLSLSRPQDPSDQVQFADGRVFEVGRPGPDARPTGSRLRRRRRVETPVSIWSTA